MFINAHEVGEGTVVDTDICIIGAGAAGITLACEFINAPFRVCLLEGGGLKYDGATQALYRGHNIGRKYYELDACRLRYFGGTTNHWGGWCRPLDPFDFEEHSWLPYSGWPFGLEELVPYYRRAQNVCQLGAYAYDNAYLQEQVGELLPLNDGETVTEVIQVSAPTRFGEVYRSKITAAANITTYLNANVTRIRTDNTPTAVSRLQVATLNGQKFWVTAKYFILATGGIENARVLLVSNEMETAGLGNEHGHVGRCFMEHPEGTMGLLLPVNPIDRRWAVYVDQYLGRDYRAPLGVIAPRKSILERDQILHCNVGLSYVPPESKGWIALRELVHGKSHGTADIGSHLRNVLSDFEDVVSDGYEKVAHGHIPPKLFNVYGYGQTTPDPESRVTLGEELDPLGLPQVDLDLRLSELSRRSMKRTLEIFAGLIGECGLGRVQIMFDDWSANTSYGWHHMGTTRMTADPRRGVVNPDCRVHSVENLYVGGSSVFPTSGSANPTLTIVALALRLADHIKLRMRG